MQALVPTASHGQKSHLTPSFNFPSLHCAIDETINMTQQPCWYQLYHMTESHFSSHFDQLELTNVVVLLVMSSVLCNMNTDITWPKNNLSPCFNHVGLANKMVPLIMPSVSCDAHPGPNSITWPQESCDTLFQLSSPNGQGDAIENTVITWQHYWF